MAMRHNITCSICGELFNSTRNNAKYCSAECKVAGMKENQKNWIANNPDYDKNRMRIYREKKKSQAH